MRRRFAALLIFGLIAVSGAAFGDSILSGATDCKIQFHVCEVHEGTTYQLRFNPVETGAVVLCEGAVMTQNGSVVGCVGGTAAYSDVVSFKLQDKTTLITMCSDSPEDNPCSIPADIKNIQYIAEEGNENSFQRTSYMPQKGWPGFDPNNKVFSYSFISDTPEPSSLFLVGSGLAGLVPVIRRRVRT